MAATDESSHVLVCLNRLLAAEQASLVLHLAESQPFISWASADEALVLENVAREQVEHIEWLTDAILDLGGEPAVRRPSMMFASVHYAEIQSLVPRIRDDIRRIIAAYEANIAGVAAVPAAAEIAARCRERHRNHLQAIEGTLSNAHT